MPGRRIVRGDADHELADRGCRGRSSGTPPVRIVHSLDARAGQDRVSRCGALPGAVADQEPEAGGAVTEIDLEMTRICRVARGPPAGAVTPRMCTSRLPASM